jgi:hypothetical protein
MDYEEIVLLLTMGGSLAVFELTSETPDAGLLNVDASYIVSETPDAILLNVPDALIANETPALVTLDL